MKTSTSSTQAFSLVEVVLALAVFTFCLLALQGLFLTGLKASHDSADDVRASNLASFLLAQRRANPTNTAVNPPCPIPALTTSTNNLGYPIYLTPEGQETSAATAMYRLTYDIQSSSYNVTRVGLTLSSPPTTTVVTARIRYDVVTYVSLP